MIACAAFTVRLTYIPYNTHCPALLAAQMSQLRQQSCPQGSACAAWTLWKVESAAMMATLTLMTAWPSVLAWRWLHQASAANHSPDQTYGRAFTVTSQSELGSSCGGSLTHCHVRHVTCLRHCTDHCTDHDQYIIWASSQMTVRHSREHFSVESSLLACT